MNRLFHISGTHAQFFFEQPICPPLYTQVHFVNTHDDAKKQGKIS